MDAARYERLQALFHEAVAVPPPARPSWLEAACGGDATLLADLRGMLEADERAASLLERDLAQVAHAVMASPAAASPPAGAFGPYRIQKVLGEGGMGVVYLADREDLGSQAAIKILRDAWLSPARRERFAGEQRVLAQLSHPSIARLYDAGALPDGTPWFVMEYVEGVPLDEYCRTQRRTIDERLRLFRDVCEAVQHAHRRLVIHRDLKPSNILVTAGGRVKLLDFGIAKQLESFETPVDHTRTGLRLMTPAYAAPEQIRGGAAGVESDVYSLGVILYELLAGRLPFDLAGRTPAEAEVAIAAQEPERPSAAGRLGVSRAARADLDVLCLTAMHKDPARRYRTVEALIRDLDHYVSGEPLEARPDSVAYRVGKFVRRNRWPVLATAAGLSVIIGLVVFYTIRVTEARNVALAQMARAQHIQQFMLNLFDGGDKEAGPPEDLRVITLLDRGVQQARSLESEPVVQADLYYALGGVFQKLGSFDRSDDLLAKALERRTALHGADSAEVAESQVARGLLRSNQAKFDEAERLVRDGLAMTRRHRPASHPSVAKATAALGRVLSDRGRYDEAVTALEEAVQLQSASGAPATELARSLTELASAHFYAGQYDASQALNERAIGLYRQAYGDRHPMVSDSLINLGAIQFEQGRYAEAERFYRQALEITRGWYGKDHHDVAANLTMLARAVNRDAARHAEALSLLEQALVIRERVYGATHPSVASTVNELGTVALVQGKLDEAEAYYRRMIGIYRQAYGDKHYLMGTAVSNLASVFMARKDFVRAEPLFRQAIDTFIATLSPTHANTGIARIKLGRVLLRQKRFADAAAETLAGYDILRPQMDPKVSWLQNARRDLVEAYDALGQPEKAARLRAELAGSAK